MRQKQKDVDWLYTQSVLVMLGNMTIGWAGVSHMLNSLIEWYQSQVGTVIRKDLPISFTGKLKYLQRMEPDIRWTAADREKLKRFRLELGRLNEFRVNVVHGVLWKKGRYSTDWDVLIAKEEGNSLNRRTMTYSNAELAEHIKAISDVGHELSPFVARIIGMPHPANR